MKNKFLTNFILSFNFLSLFHFNTNYTFLENKFFYSTLFFSFSTFYLIYKLNNFDNIDYNNLDFNKLDYLKLIEFLTSKKIDIVIEQKIVFLKSIYNLKDNLRLYKDLVNNIVFDYYKDKDHDFMPKLEAAKLTNEVPSVFKSYTDDYVKLVQPDKPIFSSRMKPYGFSSDKITQSFTFLEKSKQALTLNSDPEFFLQITQHLLT